MKHSSLLCLTLAVSLFWACDTTAQNLPKTDISSPELNRNSFSDNSYQIAGVYHIVDYSKKMEGRWGKRVNDEGGGGSCASSGYVANCPSPQTGTSVTLANGLKCYKDCKCDTSYYKYNSSNCKQPKELKGEFCNQGNSVYATKCDCPSDYGEYGENAECTSCTDSMGISRYKCTCSSEYNLTAPVSGADCVRCYVNGVSKYKCVANCNDYPLTTCPNGGICSKCPSDSTKLKLDSCDTTKGWSQSGNTCIPLRCPAGYTAGMTTCSDTTNYAYFSDGWSGGQVCGRCVKKVSDTNIVKLGVNAPADNSYLSFSLSGSGYTIDWGDGTTDSIASHTYAKAGDYIVIMSEGITKLEARRSSARITKLYTLDMDTITTADFSYNCDKLTGSIPKLPASLTIGRGMFSLCTGLTGNIPELPAGLTNGQSMFNGCSGLTGSIPELPTGLTNGQSMFLSCTGLTGTIPELPPNLTEGASMFFNCSGLTGNIPELPAGLTDGTYMFSRCSGLTGSIPELPASLTNGYSMFSGCSGLTGGIPELPAGLTGGVSMFADCSGLTGGIPELPANLTDGANMFSGCKGLTGTIPELPAGLKDGSYMFSGCKGLTGSILKLPPKLTNGSGMFQSCNGLIGSIPELPASLTNGSRMFYGCSGLTGNIPELPSSLTNGGWMFSGCSKLTGTAPAKPENMANCDYIFKNTNVAKTDEWSSCQ